MAVDFPSAPNVGDTVTDPDTGAVWVWDGTKWTHAPGGGGGGGGGTGTVTSITAGIGLTGGTITEAGTIALATPVSLADGGTSGTDALSARQGLGTNTYYLPISIPGLIGGQQSRSVVPFPSTVNSLGMFINWSLGAAWTGDAGSTQMQFWKVSGGVATNIGQVPGGNTTNGANQSGQAIAGPGTTTFVAGDTIMVNAVTPGDSTAADYTCSVQLMRSA